jgi:hypothetical protein
VNAKNYLNLVKQARTSDSAKDQLQLINEKIGASPEAQERLAVDILNIVLETLDAERIPWGVCTHAIIFGEAIKADRLSAYLEKLELIIFRSFERLGQKQADRGRQSALEFAFSLALHGLHKKAPERFEAVLQFLDRLGIPSDRRNLLAHGVAEGVRTGRFRLSRIPFNPDSPDRVDPY